MGYNTKVISRAPYGPPVKMTLDAQGKPVPKYSLMDSGDCPAADTLPPPLIWSQDDRIDPITGQYCFLSSSTYWYWVYYSTSVGTDPIFIRYQLRSHTEQFSNCSNLEPHVQYDGVGEMYDCVVPPTPQPSPSDSPSPTPPPSEPPASPSPPPPSPPDSPPPPPPSPTPPPVSPSPTPTPKPPFELTVDHEAISPNGDGVEDDTPVHIKAGVPWKLELKGGSLVGSSPLMQGSGNKDFTWSGTTGDGKGLRNGTYTMVLTDTSTGEVCQVPVTINAWTLKRELDAFSPNQPTGDGVKDTNHITAQGNGAWTISVDGHPGTAHSGTNTQSFDWDGKVNGIILPDGTYTLRLTPMGTTPNSSDPTAEVSIDTAPPLVADVNAQGHEGTPGTTISATIKDGEQGAGVLQEDIRVTCNDAPIPNEMGVHNYDPATGKFSLELNELDVAALNLPESSTGTVKITAKDKVGNSNKDKDDSFESIGPKDFVDSTTFHVASVGTYNLQAVSVSDTLFRPLLGRINTVTTTVLKPPPNHKLYPYLKGGFLTIIKSPVGRTEAVAFYTYPPWEDHTLQWSGKEPGTLKPVQDGIYKVKGYLFGLVPIKTINVTVDNRRNKDLRDKLSDWNDQKHILWGSKKRRDQGKYHNWSKFNPDINDEVPESNHTLITSLYRNRISQVIDFVMDPENAISEAPSGANGALVEYVKTVQGYRVTVKTKREYDPTTGIIIEKVSDAWVN